MSEELIWGVIRENNAFMVKRGGVLFSSEPGNLVAKHSPKYSGLAKTNTIRIEAVEGGVAISRRSAKAPASKIAGAYTPAAFIKGSASGPVRAIKLARDMQATGYRLDLTRAAQARLCALLASKKARKAVKVHAAKKL